MLESAFSYFKISPANPLFGHCAPFFKPTIQLPLTFWCVMGVACDLFCMGLATEENGVANQSGENPDDADPGTLVVFGV